MDNDKIFEKVKMKIAISNVKKENIVMKKTKLNIYKNIGIAACIIFLMTGVVSAKDIENKIKRLFNNSNNAIDIATQNGYVQTINDNYIYSKNLGIKVENILINDSILDIAYLYKYDKNVDNIELLKYTIKDNENNLLYQCDNENSKIEKPLIVKEVVCGKNQYNTERVEESLFRNSILYKADKFPKSEKLFISINHIKVNNEEIDGIWNIEVDLDNKFTQREKDVYKIINTEHILDSEITLSETTLKIYVQFDEERGNQKFLFENTPTLKNELNQYFLCSNGTWNSLDNEELKDKSEYSLECDLSKYNENIDRLYLDIPVNENLTVNLILEKQNNL